MAIVVDPLEWNWNLPFLQGVRSVLNHQSSVSDLAKILFEIEQRYNIHIFNSNSSSPIITSTYAGDNFGPCYLFPFLSETQLILAGGDLLPFYDIVTGRKEAIDLTWREWGHWLAEWANKHWKPRPEIDLSWKVRKSGAWEYIDFYMRDYIEPFITDYNIVADLMLAAISENDKLMKQQFYENF